MKMYDQLPKIGKNDLLALNTKLGFKIPKSYEGFLLQSYGGQPLNNCFKKSDAKNEFDFLINTFYGIDKNLSCDLYHTFILLNDRIPCGFLPIADDGGGNIICMGTEQNNGGKIYIFWLSEQLNTETPLSVDDISFLANNFEEFTSFLQEE